MLKRQIYVLSTGSNSFLNFAILRCLSWLLIGFEFNNNNNNGYF